INCSLNQRLKCSFFNQVQRNNEPSRRLRGIQKQNAYVFRPPGIGKSYISEKVAEGMERPLINIDLGGRTDTGILEGVSPSIKAAYPGRLCSGISISKNRGAIVLLDEFEKVRDEGLANMMGNVLDIKKNKD
ncbi:21577_t:CDS:2, partial [Racocetra persica]